ncbi:MAG: hypothetical protein Q9192_006803 [Flavoplaca navasiana]
MPPQVGTSPRFARKNVVADAFFQPNWMYFPHVYLHRLELQIDCEMVFEEVESFQGLKSAIANWKESKNFSMDRNIRRIFPPHVADSGTKKGAVFKGKPLERQMDIDWFMTAEDFYEWLIKPRIFNSAKKRLVEFTSFYQDLPLICWLSSLTEQRIQYLDFFVVMVPRKISLVSELTGMGIYGRQNCILELKLLEARDPESESYEFNRDYSRLNSKTGEILREVLKLLNPSIRIIADWEKREDSRDIRSRWSQKDETRFGPKLVYLARKCKVSIQQLNALARKKMGKSKASWGFSWNKISTELEEAAVLRLAKQENEKHLTAQSSWWYIVFWISYALESIKIYMLEGFQLWDDQSNSHTNRVSSFVRVLLSVWLVAACALILIARTLTLSATDLLSLVWQVICWLKGRMMGDSHPRAEEIHEGGISNDREKPGEVGRKSASIKSADTLARPSKTLEILLKWLQAPPRPLQRVTSELSESLLQAQPLALKPLSRTSDKVKPQMSGSDIKVDPLIQSDGMRGNDDWETILEKYFVTEGETLQPEAQLEILASPANRRTSDGSFKEKPSWWTRLKSKKASESRV